MLPINTRSYDVINLPNELISHICSYLPLSVQIRLELVCREWKGIVEDYYLVLLRNDRLPTKWPNVMEFFQGKSPLQVAKYNYLFRQAIPHFPNRIFQHDYKCCVHTRKDKAALYFIRCVQERGTAYSVNYREPIPLQQSKNSVEYEESADTKVATACTLGALRYGFFREDPVPQINDSGECKKCNKKKYDISLVRTMDDDFLEYTKRCNASGWSIFKAMFPFLSPSTSQTIPTERIEDLISIGEFQNIKFGSTWHLFNAKQPGDIISYKEIQIASPQQTACLENDEKLIGFYNALDPIINPPTTTIFIYNKINFKQRSYSFSLSGEVESMTLMDNVLALAININRVINIIFVNIENQTVRNILHVRRAHFVDLTNKGPNLIIRAVNKLRITHFLCTFDGYSSKKYHPSSKLQDLMTLNTTKLSLKRWDCESIAAIKKEWATHRLDFCMTRDFIEEWSDDEEESQA